MAIRGAEFLLRWMLSMPVCSYAPCLCMETTRCHDHHALILPACHSM